MTQRPKRSKHNRRENVNVMIPNDILLYSYIVAYFNNHQKVIIQPLMKKKFKPKIKYLAELQVSCRRGKQKIVGD